MGRILVRPRAQTLFQMNHILGTGQSLSLGSQGFPELSTTQPFSNKMFDSGINAVTFASLVDLIEGLPEPSGVETISSGMANLITDLAAALGVTHDALVSSCGYPGAAYRDIKKGGLGGGSIYQLGIDQVTAGLARATELGKTFGVPAVTMIHGEQDAEDYDGASSGPNPSYQANLVEFQSDLETDIKAITGQTGTIPLLVSQLSTFADSDIPLAQLRAHVADPSKIVLVGPKYHLPYADSLHLTNHGYRQLGEQFARAYIRRVVRGLTWSPLRPLSFATSTNTVTITFNVPTAPLALDTTLVPSTTNYGFEYVPGGGGSETITSVALVGTTQVRITLSGTPSVWGRVKYAQNANKRGNLRDSDATASLNGYTLRNWCVHFDEAVT